MFEPKTLALSVPGFGQAIPLPGGLGDIALPLLLFGLRCSEELARSREVPLASITGGHECGCSECGECAKFSEAHSLFRLEGNVPLSVDKP